jgi:hypothetical protein
MRGTLRKIFGEDSYELKGYHSASSWGRPIAGFSQAEIDSKYEARYDELLGTIRGWLDALILQVERFGLESNQTSAGVPKRYLLSSPVYIAERVADRITAVIEWSAKHKLVSLLFGGITFAGSVASIVGLAIVLS